MDGRQIILAAILAALSPCVILADEPAEDAAPSAIQSKQLEKRDQLWAEAQKLSQQGKLQDAIARTEQVVAIEREVLGDESLELATSLGFLAILLQSRDSFDAAITAREEVVAICRRQFGTEHWQTVSVEQALQRVREYKAFTTDERAVIDEAVAADRSAAELVGQGQLAQATKLFRESLAMRKLILGERHVDVASTMSNVAWLLHAQHDDAEAEPLYRQALKIKQKALGKKHPDCATILSNLADMFVAQGKFDEAEAYYAQMAEVWNEKDNQTHPAYQSSLNALGKAYMQLAKHHESQERFERAIQLHETRLGLVVKMYGPEDPTVGDARAILAHARKMATLSPGERERLKEAQQLYETAGELSESGKGREAVASAEKALALRESILGDKSYSYAESLGQLARIYEAMTQYDKAIPLFERALKITQEGLGANHPNCALTLVHLARLHRTRRQYAASEKLLRQALDIWKTGVGEENSFYIQLSNDLADSQAQQRNSTAAETTARKTLELADARFGKRSTEYAGALATLAKIYRQEGQQGRAIPLFRQALEIFEASEEMNREYVTTLVHLTESLTEMFNLSEAEAVCQRGLERSKKLFGEASYEYAACLAELARVSLFQHDNSRAEAFYLQALQINKQVSGETSHNYLVCLANLAALRLAQGNRAEAERSYRELLPLLKNDPEGYVACLNNMASFYDGAEAEPFRREVVDKMKEVFGENHGFYAAALGSLGSCYLEQRDFQKAEPFLRRALEISKRVQSEHHQDYSTHLAALAYWHELQGDYAAAEPLRYQASEITRRTLDLTFGAISERRQLVMTQHYRKELDSCIECASHLEGNADRVYSHVLTWKGAIFARQRIMRLAATRPELASRLSKLRDVTALQATLALASPASRNEDFRRQLHEVNEQREELEADLARESSDFAKSRDQLTPDALRQLLPAQTVLVDFLEYSHAVDSEQGQPPKNEQRLAAFVVRADRPVVQCELGLVEPIASAIDAWRRDFGAGAGAQAAAQTLRDLVWEPLGKQVDGASLVLVSPDGAIARFPLGALPGTRPGTYLIEELPLAVVPVPQWLPQLLERPQAGQGRSLLAMGDVDFDAASADPLPAAPAEAENPAQHANPGEPSEASNMSRSPLRGQAKHRFEKLAGTKKELLAIEGLYRRLVGPELTIRRGPDASEAAFRTGAHKATYLHLATHGFFAPPGFRSVFSAPADQRRGAAVPADFDASPLEGPSEGFPPGLLSGIALAGANHLSEVSNPLAAPADDGIMTAEEVAMLDLGRVDLAVLSACETGLGESAGGEGVLGLQRAFQVSGARTVVASLWKVHDDATRLLMERFYENLWQRRIGKLAALREAQLWMLREGRTWKDTKTARGLDLSPDQPSAADGRLPPFYWAAFTLSGDWQ